MLRYFFAFLFTLGLLLGVASLTLAADKADKKDNNKPLVHVIEIQGVISPATLDLIKREIKHATDEKADLLILEMDTPGGLYESTQQIAQAILDSSVPVATFVYPSGGHAASAGTYILYASHVAAMAPATNLGAATPIQMSPAGEKKEDEEKPKPSSTLENKMVNDAAAFIRGLAERHGRNAEWAERAVREAESLTASEALSKKVIDVIADDSAALADKLEGRVVIMGKDTKKTLSTKGAEIVRIEPGLRHDLLEIITHPNVALLLMSLGTYGLIYEFANPGALFPGIIGAICLLLGLYAMNILPVNYSALALIMLGIGLMTAEAFATTFGLLGISGAIAFIIGAVMLVESDMPGFGVDWWMIALMTTTSFAFLSLLLGLVVKSHRKPAKTGIEEILQAEGEIIGWSGRTGDVRLTGEVWKAISLDDHILKSGDLVRIKSIEGLILTIEPKR